jgi:3-dehydroquinate synthase
VSITRVKLPAPGNGEYDVVVEPGLLHRAPALLVRHAPASGYAVIADTNVAPLYGERLAARLGAAGLDARLFVHPAGEPHKTLATWSTLMDALLSAGLDRDACVVALGGGVTGDLAGFVAATYLRGIAFVQLPTTLLAMVDASVGGKTGVDSRHGKNLVGAFHQPRFVGIDPEVLHTLPLPELRSGAAEVVKHGAIADAGYFDHVVAAAPRLLAGDAALLGEVIARSVELKAAVVGRDPLERGERAVLNFGHTLGHALERVTGYGVAHGHAVSTGMVLAAKLGEGLGVTHAGTSHALADALGAFGLPVSPPADVAWDALLEAAGSDKKGRRGRPRFVLLRRIGEVAKSGEDWTHRVDDEALRRVAAAV